MRKFLIISSFLAVLIITIVLILKPAKPGLVIYVADTIVTMAKEGESYQAIATDNDKIVGIGTLNQLTQSFPTAKVDHRFADKTLFPGFIDPHIHMLLAAIEYSLPIAPPWSIPMDNGIIQGLEDRPSFLNRIREITEESMGSDPIVIYGYHDLVHGPLTRHDLDAISTSRPIFIWHYSTHDFYLNSKALHWSKITKEMHSQFEGIAIGKQGELTGRVYEDALPLLMDKLGGTIGNPLNIRRGANTFSRLLRRGGVTSVADLGYGIVGKTVEDLHLFINWRSSFASGYRVYLVPEHRAFKKKYGDESAETIVKLVEGNKWAAAPVLPQVKFFMDGAYYSQTMRISSPGYLDGQSKGTQGVWVTQPQELYSLIEPYWDAGLGVRIHSNGDASQTEVLKTLEKLREKSLNRRFVFEHSALFSPNDIIKAGELDAAVSVASHYINYLGEHYREPLGAERSDWIAPLASLDEHGVIASLHSDAPLAPPLPLVAASMNATRLTREGTTHNSNEKLSAFQALRTITYGAAYSMGLEKEIGTLEPGKKADFTVLEKNPLELAPEKWPEIKIWGVLVGGHIIPLEE